jgi:hypothetical protein
MPCITELVEHFQIRGELGGTVDVLRNGLVLSSIFGHVCSCDQAVGVEQLGGSVNGRVNENLQTNEDKLGSRPMITSSSDASREQQ